MFSRILSITTAVSTAISTGVAADARPNTVQYYGGSGSSSASKTSATNSSAISSNHQYKVFYQYYVHYFNWYAKRTRSQEQCRKLAALAAVRQITIEKAAESARTGEQAKNSSKLELPGVGLANSVSLSSPASGPASPSVQPGHSLAQAVAPPETNKAPNIVSERPAIASSIASEFVPTKTSTVPNTPPLRTTATSSIAQPSAQAGSSAPRAQEITQSGSEAPGAPASSGLRPPIKTAFTNTNSSKRAGRLRSRALRDSIASASAPINNDIASGATPTLDSSVASKNGATANEEYVPTLRGLDSVGTITPPPLSTQTQASRCDTQALSPMMQIAAAVSQNTKPAKKWWQPQFRKNPPPERKLLTAQAQDTHDPVRSEPPAVLPSATPTLPNLVASPSQTQVKNKNPQPAQKLSAAAPLTGGITKKTEITEVASAPFERAWAKERYAEAKVFASDLARLMPDSRYYAARYYVCCIQTADWTNAYTALERLVSLDKAHSDIYLCDYGRILFELRQYEPAKAKLKHALACGNDSEPLHRTLLLIAIAQKDDKAALSEYQHIARLCPGDFDSRIELAELLWKCNQKDEAVRVYDQVAAMIPDNADIQSKAGYANLVQGNYKAAMNAYKLASDSSPQQKFKNAQEFAEAQFMTVQKMASTHKPSSQD